MRIFVPLLIFALTSCSSKFYTYKATMTHPVNSSALLYENDTFSISFALDPQAIKTIIYNKSDDGIRVNWDEVSFSVNGKTYRALHSQTGIDHFTEVQPPTTIPPKSNLNDELIPSDHVSFVRTGYGISPHIRPLFPDYDYGKSKTKDYIMSWKGSRVTIYLPFYIKGQLESHYYDLIITDIIESKHKGK